MAPTEPNASLGAQSQRPVPVWPSACRVSQTHCPKGTVHTQVTTAHHLTEEVDVTGLHRQTSDRLRQAQFRRHGGDWGVWFLSARGVLSIASQMLSLTRKGPKTPLASASEAEGCGGSCLGEMGLGLRGRKENYQVGLDQMEESRQCRKVGISPLTSSQHPSTGGPGAA